jgi:histidinol-phosphate aminotransferase
MGFNLEKVLRKNIKAIVPYSTARDEYQGKADIYLDANESPFNTGLNRYPDPHHKELKIKVSAIKGIQPENILLTNGSDEAIDLIYRTFCNPGKDNVLIVEPTYGMYKVSAQINDVAVKSVLLKDDFQPDTEAIFKAIDNNTKLIFLCSPNNPTGNAYSSIKINFILQNFEGIVVIDEAYADFSSHSSYLLQLNSCPNLIVLQTFSKAWGLAAIRLGMLSASEEIIKILHQIKPPYNINQLTQKIAIEAINNVAQKDSWVKAVLAQKQVVENILKTYSIVEKVYPSDANFLLVKFKDAHKIFADLMRHGIIVRNRTKTPLCENCLRITIGTMEENLKLLQILKQY